MIEFEYKMDKEIEPPKAKTITMQKYEKEIWEILFFQTTVDEVVIRFKRDPTDAYSLTGDYRDVLL